MVQSYLEPFILLSACTNKRGDIFVTIGKFRVVSLAALPPTRFQSRYLLSVGREMSESEFVSDFFREKRHRTHELYEE
ncbi:hypothetical protein LSTR_LSTR006250 [Laodelphax striatellus]|uniref:Uncharacterized protein n=1 Tax=Laodelphax striatellus TaxID=195883 RepID=A0A482WID3_LAOST|nr:hypothetical protein LSTR_LSTR006250 [Laodelphax striatellus]